MAKASGEITPEANECLENIRRGTSKGIIHPIITYEFLLQFYKGQLPVFRTSDEALDFLETNFSTVNISNSLALKAAEIKFKSRSIVAKLKRHLSVCDSLTVAIAKDTKSKIISGDRDLQAAAEKENLNIIW